MLDPPGLALDCLLSQQDSTSNEINNLDAL
jgi:hypothetical protein